MDIKKLLESLNVDKLDEAKQTEIEEKLNAIVDVKLVEKLEEKESALKEMLTEEYEEKFETYKNDITEKFSNFVDEVLEQELTIPENIIEFARKGELYSELIEQFKTRLAIDEDMINEEIKDLLKEARDEIKNLKDQYNAKIDENLTLTVDKDKFEVKTYLHEKVKGLPLEDAEKIMTILEDETDFDVIDKKYNTLVDSVLEISEHKTNDEATNLLIEARDEIKKLKGMKVDDTTTIVKESSIMSQWLNTLKEEM